MCKNRKRRPIGLKEIIQSLKANELVKEDGGKKDRIKYRKKAAKLSIATDSEPVIKISLYIENQ